MPSKHHGIAGSKHTTQFNSRIIPYVCLCASQFWGTQSTLSTMKGAHWTYALHGPAQHASKRTGERDPGNLSQPKYSKEEF